MRDVAMIQKLFFLFLSLCVLSKVCYGSAERNKTGEVTLPSTSGVTERKNGDDSLKDTKTSVNSTDVSGAGSNSTSSVGSSRRGKSGLPKETSYNSYSHLDTVREHDRASEDSKAKEEKSVYYYYYPATMTDNVNRKTLSSHDSKAEEDQPIPSYSYPQATGYQISQAPESTYGYPAVDNPSPQYGAPQQDQSSGYSLPAPASQNGYPDSTPAPTPQSGYGYPAPSPPEPQQGYGYPAPAPPPAPSPQPVYGYPAPAPPAPAPQQGYGYPDPAPQQGYGYPAPAPPAPQQGYGYPDPAPPAPAPQQVYGYPSPAPAPVPAPQYGYPQSEPMQAPQSGYGYPAPQQSQGYTIQPLLPVIPIMPMDGGYQAPAQPSSGYPSSVQSPGGYRTLSPSPQPSYGYPAPQPSYGPPPAPEQPQGYGKSPDYGYGQGAGNLPSITTDGVGGGDFGQGGASQGNDFGHGPPQPPGPPQLPPAPAKGSIDYVLIPLILIGITAPIFVVVYVVLGSMEAKLAPVLLRRSLDSLSTYTSSLKPTADALMASVSRALDTQKCWERMACEAGTFCQRHGMSDSGWLDKSLQPLVPKSYQTQYRTFMSAMHNPQEDCSHFTCLQ